MGWLVLACRLVVGGVYIYASLGKLGDPRGFAEAIFNYRMLPYLLLHPAAHLLPVLELVAGLALVLGVGRRGAALIAAVLTAVFVAAIATALARHLDISCGCFHTDGGDRVGLSLLGRDLVLLLLCLPPLCSRRGGPAMSDFFRK